MWLFFFEISPYSLDSRVTLSSELKVEGQYCTSTVNPWPVSQKDEFEAFGEALVLYGLTADIATGLDSDLLLVVTIVTNNISVNINKRNLKKIKLISFYLFV